MITIDREAGSLSTQVYEQTRQLILSGSLRQGDRLVPSRLLAEDIGVSRNTVVEAYEQLTAEGFVTSRQGAGLFVASVKPQAKDKALVAAENRFEPSRLSTRVSGIPSAFLRRNKKYGARYEFLYGEPSYEDFPQESWARTLGKVARQVRSEHLSYPAYQGLDALRQSLVGYLARARGIHCSPDNLVVVHGTQEGIDLICRLLLNPDDTVVCEHPCYRGFLKASLAAGADVRFVDVDEQGIDTSSLPDNAKLAFVTPSHQFPSGGILSIGRRLELLAWAKSSHSIILEDDYDGEFRYGGSPVDSLKSLDEAGNVVYVGTVSKTFFPALRLGWMVVPDGLVQPLLDLRAISDTTPPAMEQLALAEYIDSGQFERHIFRVRKRYAEKRRVLLSALITRLGDRVSISGSDAGIHVLMSIPGLSRDRTQALLNRCRARDVSVHSAEMYYTKKPRHVELVIGYNAVPVDDIAAGAGIMAEEILAMLHSESE